MQLICLFQVLLLFFLFVVGFGSTFYLLMDEEKVKISFSSPSYLLYRYRGQIYEATKLSKIKIYRK